MSTDALEGNPEQEITPERETAADRGAREGQDTDAGRGGNAAGGNGGQAGGDGATPDYSKDKNYLLWVESEKLAMHFNELIVRLRTQALVGLSGVVAISGFAMNATGKPSTASEWKILTATIVFLLFSWIALFVLDVYYYNRLLLGAVKAVKNVERRTNGHIMVSHAIEAAVTGGSNAGNNNRDEDGAVPVPRAVVAFYLIVGVALLIGVGFGIFQWREPLKSGDAMKASIEHSAGEKVHLQIEPPAKPSINSSGTPQTSKPKDPKAVKSADSVTEKKEPLKVSIEHSPGERLNLVIDTPETTSANSGGTSAGPPAAGATTPANNSGTGSQGNGP